MIVGTGYGFRVLMGVSRPEKSLQQKKPAFGRVLLWVSLVSFKYQKRNRRRRF